MNGFNAQTSGTVGAWFNQAVPPSACSIGDIWYDSYNVVLNRWDGTAWQTLYSPPIRGDKNIVINGNFDVWQRGITFATIANNAYSADRWAYYVNGSIVHTLSRSSDVPTVTQSGTFSNYSLLATCTTALASIAAGNYCVISTIIEGYNITKIAQRPFTVSFWVKAFKPGIYTFSLRNSGTDRCFTKEFSVNASNVWEKKIISVPATPSGGTWQYTTGRGLYMMFALAVGSTFQTSSHGQWITTNVFGSTNQVNGVDSTSNTFQLAQVQVEPGIFATPFEQRLYVDELARCQRYCVTYGDAGPLFERIGSGQATAATSADVWLNLPVEMVGTPTINSATLASTFATFCVTNAAGAAVALSGAPTLNTAGTTRKVLNMQPVPVASGLVAGNATEFLKNNNATNLFIIDADYPS